MAFTRRCRPARCDTGRRHPDRHRDTGRGRHHRGRARPARRRLPARPDGNRCRRPAHARGTDRPGFDVPVENPRPVRSGTRPRSGRGTARGPLPRGRLRHRHSRPRRSRYRPFRRPDERVSHAGRPRRAGDRRERHRRRGDVLSRCAAAGYRDAQDSRCEQQRYRAHLCIADRCRLAGGKPRGDRRRRRAGAFAGHGAAGLAPRIERRDRRSGRDPAGAVLWHARRAGLRRAAFAARKALSRNGTDALARGTVGA